MASTTEKAKDKIDQAGDVSIVRVGPDAAIVAVHYALG